jgi:hypothetical protein
MRGDTLVISQICTPELTNTPKAKCQWKVESWYTEYRTIWFSKNHGEGAVNGLRYITLEHLANLIPYLDVLQSREH